MHSDLTYVHSDHHVRFSPCLHFTLLASNFRYVLYIFLIFSLENLLLQECILRLESLILLKCARNEVHKLIYGLLLSLLASNFRFILFLFLSFLLVNLLLHEFSPGSTSLTLLKCAWNKVVFVEISSHTDMDMQLTMLCLYGLI